MTAEPFKDPRANVVYARLVEQGDGAAVQLFCATQRDSESTGRALAWVLGAIAALPFLALLSAFWT